MAPPRDEMADGRARPLLPWRAPASRELVALRRNQLEPIGCWGSARREAVCARLSGGWGLTSDEELLRFAVFPEDRRGQALQLWLGRRGRVGEEDFSEFWLNFKRRGYVLDGGFNRMRTWKR